MKLTCNWTNDIPDIDGYKNTISNDLSNKKTPVKIDRGLILETKAPILCSSDIFKQLFLQVLFWLLVVNIIIKLFKVENLGEDVEVPVLENGLVVSMLDII